MDTFKSNLCDLVYFLNFKFIFFATLCAFVGKSTYIEQEPSHQITFYNKSKPNKIVILFEFFHKYWYFPISFIWTIENDIFFEG